MTNNSYAHRKFPFQKARSYLSPITLLMRTSNKRPLHILNGIGELCQTSYMTVYIKQCLCQSLGDRVTTSNNLNGHELCSSYTEVLNIEADIDTDNVPQVTLM